MHQCLITSSVNKCLKLHTIQPHIDCSQTRFNSVLLLWTPLALLPKKKTQAPYWWVSVQRQKFQQKRLTSPPGGTVEWYRVKGALRGSLAVIQVKYVRCWFSFCAATKISANSAVVLLLVVLPHPDLQLRRRHVSRFSYLHIIAVLTLAFRSLGFITIQGPASPVYAQKTCVDLYKDLLGKDGTVPPLRRT